MTALAEILRDRIRREGPMPFREFMHAALYHPTHGYYRRRLSRPSGGDPFGAGGDFYTAEQLQPVFGVLVCAAIRALAGEPDIVVELGAGRGEMGEAFGASRYLPIDVDNGELPSRFSGVVFANEFFDALPVAIVNRQGLEMRVGLGAESSESEPFVWIAGDPASEELRDYIARYLPLDPSIELFEVNLDALRWLERVNVSLERGWIVTIDYGYTRREYARFPLGTLMSYRRHTALENVLASPGEQDISAHVNFTALSEYGAALGFENVRLETLAQTLLRTGEADGFAAALSSADETEALRRRLQLKTLLFGMGETFRVLTLRKETRPRK